MTSCGIAHYLRNNNKITTETNGKYLTIHIADDATTKRYSQYFHNSRTGRYPLFKAITYVCGIITLDEQPEQVAAGGCRAYTAGLLDNKCSLFCSLRINRCLFHKDILPVRQLSATASIRSPELLTVSMRLKQMQAATLTSSLQSHLTRTQLAGRRQGSLHDHTNATLYLKELTAGAGYKLNPDVISVQLDSSNQTVTLKDEPITDPLNWTLQKTDANKYNIATGLTLAGAVFEVAITIL